MDKLICNCCGKILDPEREDFLFVRKDWGYFSKKDLTRHEWVLCEACYDALTAGFQYPAAVLEQTEL